MMPIKQKTTNKILIFLLSVIALLTLAVFVVPPMITLNNLKPKIEDTIFTKTGIKAEIHGDVNFSLIGNTTIVAHNVSISNGVISSVEFNFPLIDIFNIQNTTISGDIYVKGAALYVEKIVPFEINNNIIVKDSKIKFLNKEYQIINGKFSKQNIETLVRTDQHKYEIKSINNKFVIKNKNNDLLLSGELFRNGTARGHISIVAQDVNRWFEFKSPQINGRFPITADVFWNGNYGIKFDNISAENVHGSIEFQDNGYKIIKLTSNDANYNMSFFIKNPEILQNSFFDLDFRGNLTFMNQKLDHIKMITIGSDKKIKIDTIIAGNTHISGGFIDENGAHNVHISTPENGVNTTCLFNGTPTKWSCDKFSYGNSITANFSIDNKKIDADVFSNTVFADMKPFVSIIRKIAEYGTIRFDFPDMTGTLHLTKNDYTVEYTRLDNKSLNQAKVNLKFLPKFMKEESGDFVWVNGIMIFTPDSKQWQLSKHTDFFILRGNNFKELSQNTDLQFMNNLPYVISGNYKNGTISDFSIEIAGHKFTGSLSGKSIKITTNVLNLDSFLDQSFIDRFEELSFFTNHPILIPFETNYNIALSANKLIFQDQEYKNFVYSLNGNSQSFSISDSNRGNMLATIKKNNIKYAINIQLNKFVFDKKILSETMPLNISDTSVTAEIKLTTFGKIAHDIISNLSGTFDASFDGGKLYGLGLAKFYASASNLTILNGEFALYKALTGGVTPIKKMHIIGDYEKGNIKTTEPFVLYMMHTDATGILQIENNEMAAKMKLILRGTSAGPEAIDLTIYPNDTRDFSLSEIMMHFDPEYMREFVKSHNQF